MAHNKRFDGHNNHLHNLTRGEEAQVPRTTRWRKNKQNEEETLRQSDTQDDSVYGLNAVATDNCEPNVELS